MPNTYATPTNIRLALGDETLMRLLNVYEPTEIPTHPALLQKINWANATIDSYLRSVAILPLPGDPDVEGYYPDLIEHAANLVRWGLVGTRTDVESANDRARYNDAIRYLRDISEGVSSLDLIELPHDHPTGASVVRINNQSDPICIVDPCHPERYY